MTELVSWNPWLTGNCDSALFAGLNDTATRAVCIGTGTATATLTPSTTVTGSAAQTTISAE
jgi:D-hexose-6-phosphate mutarotase